jgi:hypothetical protein|tara:strand:+ start:234 stop:1295 length:1062 start_codon:yes stop_codon:yes gene_type:complete
MSVKLKNIAANLSTPFLSGIVNNFMNSGSQKDAGKVSAQLLKKSPFDIPDSPSQKLRENPLSFSPVQYPLDLGSNELGHYIMFESGFVGYSPQTSGFLEMSKDRGGHPLHRSRKLTSKLPDRSIVTSAVALYMPQSVKVGYSQNYDSDTETGLAGTAEATGMAIGDAEGAAAKVQAAMQGIVGGVATQAKEILGEFISLAGMGDPVRFAAKRAGVAVNPRNEAFYSSPSQRTFSFEFDFWPRNAKEAQAVEDIILIFKYNSAPGFADKTQQSVFTTPNYWKVSYMYNGGENPHLNKIGACFCTDVQVDYAPDGQFTTFGGEITKGGGVPVHTKLTVSMLEDRIITKTDIEAGA